MENKQRDICWDLSVGVVVKEVGNGVTRLRGFLRGSDKIN